MQSKYFTSNVEMVEPKHSSATTVVSSFWPTVCAAAGFSSIPMVFASFACKSNLFTLQGIQLNNNTYGDSVRIVGVVHPD